MGNYIPLIFRNSVEYDRQFRWFGWLSRDSSPCSPTSRRFWTPKFTKTKNVQTPQNFNVNYLIELCCSLIKSFLRDETSFRHRTIFHIPVRSLSVCWQIAQQTFCTVFSARCVCFRLLFFFTNYSPYLHAYLQTEIPLSPVLLLFLRNFFYFLFFAVIGIDNGSVARKCKIYLNVVREKWLVIQFSISATMQCSFSFKPKRVSASTAAVRSNVNNNTRDKLKWKHANYWFIMLRVFIRLLWFGVTCGENINNEHKWNGSKRKSVRGTSQINSKCLAKPTRSSC